MARYARLTNTSDKTCYHIMSRTALSGFPFEDLEKDEFVRIVKRFSSVYFVEVFGFCIMGNHIHLVVQMLPGDCFSDEDIKRRFISFYGKEVFYDESKMLPYLRKKWSNISTYMQEIKQTFSRYFNKRHNRRGTLWGERFKSVIVEKGETLVNCLSYVDLNPVRAGIVDRPEKYRWNTLGYLSQTDNKDDFLSFDLGIKEFGEKNKSERIRRYREYVYEAGAIDHPEKPYAKVIDEKTIKKERAKNFEITRYDRFRNRTRYFTDSGVIGTKKFVSEHYFRFKDIFQCKHEKIPKPVKGIEGMFSLKRLSEG